MKSIRIITHDDFVKPLVKRLHDEGIMEVEDVRKLEDARKALDIPVDDEDAKQCSELLVRLDKVIGILKSSAKTDTGGIKAMLKPPLPPTFPVRKRNLEKLVADVEDVLNDLEKRVLDSEKALADVEEKVAELGKQRENIMMASVLDFDISLLGNVGESDCLLVKLGLTGDPEGLRALFKGMDIAVFSRPVEERDHVTKGDHVTLLVMHIEDKENYQAKVSRDLFQDLSCGEHSGRPAEVIKKIEDKIAGLDRHEASVLDGMDTLYKQWEGRLITLREELAIDLERLTVLSKFGKTKATSTVFGWCPAKQESELRDMVKSTTQEHSVVLSENPKDDDVPILIKNPRWARPFETLTEMFALPRYGEIDPTVIIAPIFVIFFGLMLGDALYGVMVLIAGVILLKGMGRVNRSMRDFGIILSAIGVSTIILGSLQGGFMGPLDVNNPVTALFEMIGFKPMLLVDPMANPIGLLQLALVIGLIHINIGLAVAVYQNAHNRKWKAILHDQVSWFLLEPCGALWIYEFFGWATFLDMWMNIAGIGILVGLVLLFIRKGPLAFFDITGFIGNWLSYARLLALGLATAGIALTINIILGMVMSVNLNWLCCSIAAALFAALLAVGHLKQKSALKYLSMVMLPIAIIGIFSITFALFLVGGIIFIAVHIGNAALQALGAFIHSLRLQYVEFFGQFYEGGGKRFNPFKLKREFTILEEVEK
jgi:V/A-type H+-transporting ATPase subunit I